MSARDAWEFASFVVTALGLPCAIAFFAWEQRKERDNEEEEGYQLLSDAYNDFLKVVQVGIAQHDLEEIVVGVGKQLVLLFLLVVALLALLPREEQDRDRQAERRDDVAGELPGVTHGRIPFSSTWR